MRNVVFFLRFFIWFSLRNIRRHLGRALTVLLGIALGAAVFTSVRLAVNASLESFSKSVDLIAGRADLVLVQPGGYVPENLIAPLLNHPAVEGASPVLTTYTRPVKATSEPFVLIGFDPILDRKFRDWQTAGAVHQNLNPGLAFLKHPYALVLGEALVREYGRGKGGTLTLEHSHRQADFRILGRLAPEGLALAEGGRVALTDIATFQEFTGLYGVVDRIDLKLKPGATPKEIEDIRKLLPASIAINPPSAVRKSGQAMIRAYQLNLSILSFASLFVGMFLVYSLVALNVAARRQELAILRSTGASANLLFCLFLSEGALLGVSGWLMAIPLSSLLIKYLLHGVSQTVSTLFVRVQVEKLSLDVWEILLSLGVTIFISVLAAYQPAREAMRIAPKEALEISQTGLQSRKSPRQLAVAGLACILMVWPLSRLPGVLDMPLPGYLAILLLFAGFSLLAPWVLEKIGHALSPILRRRAGIPAYLAGRYVRAGGTRAAVPVGALITAVALFTSLVIMIYSFRQTVELWAYQTVSGDLFLTTKLGGINQFRYPLDPQVVEGLQNIDAAADIIPSRRFPLRYKSFPYEFEVLDMETFFRYGAFFWLVGDPLQIRPRLVRGEGVVVSEVFSNRTGLSAGDILQAQIEASRVKLPILGVIRDYRTHGGVVFYSMAHFKARYHDPRWSGARFFFKERHQDLDAAVSKLRRTIIERFGDSVEMVSGKNLRQSILRIFDETFAVTTILLLIALAIAALGIATTLTVQVLERSRQLNTLFAVGAAFDQIRSMIFCEAAFMVVIGELAGIACGFILSHLLIFVINRQSFGWTFLYSVDWGILALSVPLIIMTALGAALPAVKLVFREPPATLLRER